MFVRNVFLEVNFLSEYRKIVDKIVILNSPEKAYKALGMSRTKFYRFFSELKKSGVIVKIGYGVWEVDSERADKFFSMNEQSGMVSKLSEEQFGDFVVGTDRAHAFQFTLPYPFSTSFSKNNRVLEYNSVDFVVSGVKGLWKGHRFFLGDWNVHLTPKGVSASLSSKISFYSGDSHEAWLSAFNDFISVVVNRLERFFGVSFKKGGVYRFRTSSQHHARIKDSVAKGYRLRKDKLRVRDEAGSLWLIADFSNSVDELEAVNSSTAVDDYTVVNNFMNSVRDSKVTMHDVLGLFAKGQEQISTTHSQMAYYAEHIKAHVESVKQLGVGVERLTEVVEDIDQKKKKDLSFLKKNICSLDDFERYRSDIAKLSMGDRELLSLWIYETFGGFKENE